MKISSSSITMSANSTSIEAHKKEESMRLWVGSNPGTESRNQASSKLADMQQDILELSEEAKNKLAQSTQPLAKAEELTESEPDLTDKDRQKIILLQKMIEMLTGKKIKINTLDDLHLKKIAKAHVPAAAKQVQPAQQQGWGLEYDYHETHYESQKMSFSSQGMIKTEDGKEIHFSLDVSMSREFMSSQHISIRAGNALLKDPLVINFGNTSPSLTEKKYSFDIDADGKSDQISFVSQGSGFLSLDLNNDGIINDGRELFGTQSGNGFNDLAQYDLDGNQWIDENDPIFDRLRIWTKDEEGNDQLLVLGQKGIGAIYLGNVNTDFSLKNNSNELQGQIRKTGIFLKENGTAGTIQHIDLAI